MALNLAADRQARLILEIDVGKLLAVVVAHDIASVQFLESTMAAGSGVLSAPAGHGRGTGNVPRISRFVSKNGN